MRLLFRILRRNPIFIQTRSESGVYSVTELGKSQKLNTYDSYPPGQLFVHKTFAYRGMIIFPWVVKVLESSPSEGTEETHASGLSKTVKKTFYYQVLIDNRDRIFVKNFMRNEGVTFLKKVDHEYKLFSLPGMDHVAHEEVLPYTPTRTVDQAIQHELFDTLFNPQEGKQPKFLPTDILKSWEFGNALDLQVYRQTTDEVRVTVVPFFVGSHEFGNSIRFWWRYSVRLENLGKNHIQLNSHHWRIFSQWGLLETTRGLGVAGGLVPVLCPQRFPAFQYSSHVSLPTPSGHMWGTLLMDKKGGPSFECQVPMFLLENKDSSKTTQIF